MPMNCRKDFPNYNLSENALKEVKRIETLWNKCRVDYGKNGEWLFGKYSIADAMFAPIALRFAGYDVSLGLVAKEYVNSVLNQPCIKEWIEAGKNETEIIDLDEV